MAEGKIENMHRGSIVTLYAHTGDFTNDVGKEIPLKDNLSNYTVISILFYDTSIAGGNRMYATFMLYTSAIYLPVGFNNTYDIIRLEASGNRIHFIEHKNTSPVCLHSVYGIPKS